MYKGRNSNKTKAKYKLIGSRQRLSSLTPSSTIIIIIIMTRETQVEKESKSVGLEKKDSMNRVRWRVGVGQIAAKVG